MHSHDLYVASHADTCRQDPTLLAGVDNDALEQITTVARQQPCWRNPSKVCLSHTQNGRQEQVLRLKSLPGAHGEHVCSVCYSRQAIGV